jgi:LacI family transcriptional regulator
MPVRIKDIAADLGVSLMTVSKVLRGEPGISEATRQRVLKRAKELNYVPNVNARSLVTGQSFLVGMVVPDLLHPFFADVARGLSQALRREGFFLIVTSSEEDPELEAREIEQLMARRLDALVIASVRPNARVYQDIGRYGIPYILIDRDLKDATGYFVGCDDVQIGIMATEHLIASGCARIAHIRGPESSTGRGRFTGYKRALEKHGMKKSVKYVVTSKMADVDGQRSGVLAAQELMQLDPPPDGIFCFNDTLAIGAMKALLDGGWKIPQDVALIGCGNIHYDEALRVPLSSIDQHSHEMGLRVAELALALMRRQDNALPRKILLSPTLVVRESSRR